MLGSAALRLGRGCRHRIQKGLVDANVAELFAVPANGASAGSEEAALDVQYGARNGMAGANELDRQRVDADRNGPGLHQGVELAIGLGQSFGVDHWRDKIE